ncbi:Abi family protein [Xanthomonas campestris pv. campestris]|uniref:Abi family protein n=1 Tax=Xanthomonas campestris TaxID=339 RepID=UPI001C854FBB|nr:Abi family protein [Xanthomonas campestris]
MAQNLFTNLKKWHTQLNAWWTRYLRRKTKFRYPQIYAKSKGLIPYSKPALTNAKSVQKLLDAGLGIQNKAVAEKTLSNVNYFRLKIYFRPYLQAPDFKNFIPGSTIEVTLDLYEFDRKLRMIVFDLIGQIELLVRHRVDVRMTSYTGNPFWYLDNNLYREYPTRTLEMIRSSSLNSKEDFARHFHEKYHNGKGGTFHLLPPFWIASELLTIGQLFYFINGLEKSKFSTSGNNSSTSNELDELAKDFDAFNIQTFSKWVEYIRNVRNVCAHHGRLWNRHLAEPPTIPRRLTKKIQGNAAFRHRIYNHLVMMRAILYARGYNDNIAKKMKDLFANHPNVEAMKIHMGFPNDWEQDPFWN